MANARQFLAQLSSPSIKNLRVTPITIAMRPLSMTMALRQKGRILSKREKEAAANGVMRAMGSSNQQKKRKDAMKKKRKARSSYKVEDISRLPTFSLVDAMQYIRAAEVGQKPSSVKYEIALKLASLKNGPVVRNRLRLPHPVKTDFRICVICPPDSKYAAEAKAAGASLVGEESIFEVVKDGKMEFDRCICQLESLDKLNKAQLGRILGPKGLMPSTKMGTVVKDPVSVMKEMTGAAEYRERLGVVRMTIGQLGFSPQELRANLKAFMDSVTTDISQIQDKVNKTIAEVVLSSTHGPGLTLNGTFTSEKSIDPQELSRSN